MLHLLHFFPNNELAKLIFNVGNSQDIHFFVWVNEILLRNFLKTVLAFLFLFGKRHLEITKAYLKKTMACASALERLDTSVEKLNSVQRPLLKSHTAKKVSLSAYVQVTRALHLLIFFPQ